MNLEDPRDQERSLPPSCLPRRAGLRPKVCARALALRSCAPHARSEVRKPPRSKLTIGKRAPETSSAAEDSCWPPVDNYVEQAGGGTG
jgi:hypothetical protein